MSTTTFCPVSRTLGRRPEELLPAVPYLLGYHPTDSLVCLFFGADDEMRLSSRVDWDTTRLATHDVVATLSERAGNCDAHSVLIVAMDPQQPDWEVLTHLCVGFLDRGLTIDWAGECRAGAWRGLECTDDCDRHVLDPQCVTVTRLIAEGVAPAADRDEVTAEVTAAADQLDDDVAVSVPLHPGGLEAWRDEMIPACLAVLERGGALSDAEIATFAVGMSDIRVRDVVLWRLTCGGHRPGIADPQTWQVVSAVLRQAPGVTVAPVAAVAALVAWQRGEGTRAMAALPRAWAADPQHSLAELVYRCVDAAVPPTVWWQVMSGLDEPTCRHGEIPHE